MHCHNFTTDKTSTYNIHIILHICINLESGAAYMREICNPRKLFWYLKTQPENQIKDFTVAWRTTMHRRNESGISRFRRETDITAQISRGRSCICTCEKRAKYEIRRDEIRGRIFDAPQRKIQSNGKRKLSIRDTVAYIYGNVSVRSLRDDEGMDYRNIRRIFLTRYIYTTLYENVSLRKSLWSFYISTFSIFADEFVESLSCYNIIHGVNIGLSCTKIEKDITILFLHFCKE